MITIIHLSAAPNPLVGNIRGGTFSRAHLMIQKLQKWSSFWIQKQQKYWSFWIRKLGIWTKKFLDPQIVEMVRFLFPETTEILPFLDPEIVKMDKTISGSRNCRNGAISGSRNRRKGWQILYVHIVQIMIRIWCKYEIVQRLYKFPAKLYKLSKHIV